MTKINKETKSIREKHTKGELIKNVLKSIAVDGVLAAGIALPNVVQLLDFFGVTSSKERRKLFRTLNKMKGQRLVRIYEKDGLDVIEITKLGIRKVLSYSLENIKITRPKKWDGYWRMIIFDVPEKNKKARRALSLKLNDMGFFPLQKSVFVCPFECEKEIEFVAEFYGIKKYIKQVLAKKIEGDYFLKRFYNL